MSRLGEGCEPGPTLGTSFETGEVAGLPPFVEQLEEGHGALAVRAADETARGRLAFVVVVAGRALLLEGADVPGRLGELHEPLLFGVRRRFDDAHVVLHGVAQD